MSNITRKQLIQDTFKLRKTEYLVFKTILDSTGKTPLSIKELLTKIPKDRTTIQKIIKTLMKQGLIIKKKQNIDRGFRFLYQGINKDLIIMTIETHYNKIEQERKNIIIRWKVEVENDY